jgi:REP element-mobilizing transposase RayT
MPEPRISLEADKYFHIFNHGVGSENIFIDERNYNFFLINFKEYISPYADLLSYCLMPNHFHLAVRFHSFDEIRKEFIFQNIIKDSTLTHEKLSELLSQQFSNYFNRYAKSFNKQEYRRGTLFMSAFKRKPIDSDYYLKRLIRYIHLNPVNDNFASLPSDWKYSSYNSLISLKPTLLTRDEVISLFDTVDNFIYFHQQKDDAFEF